MNNFQIFFESNYLEELQLLFEDKYNILNQKLSFRDFTRAIFEETISNVSYESFSHKHISRKKTNIKKIKQNLFASLLTKVFSIKNIPAKPNSKNIRDAYEEFLLKSVSIKNFENIDAKNLIPNSLLTDYDIFKKSSVSNNTQNTLFQVYKVNTFEEHCRKVISEIYTWVNTEQQPLSSYRFLETIKKSKLKSYLVKDMELFILIKLYDYMQSAYTPGSTPEMALLNSEDVFRGVDYSNRRRTSQREGSMYIHINQLNEHEIVKTMIDMSYTEDSTNPKLFNSLDCDIVMCLLELSGKNFFNTKKVTCELSDIINKLASTNKYHVNGKLYKDTYNSILKLRSFQSSFENVKSKNNIKYTIFYQADFINKDHLRENSTNSKKNSDKAVLTKEDSDKEYKKLILQATFSDAYIAQLLEKPVFTEKNFNSSSKLTNYLIAPLQSERFKLLGSQNLEATLGYESFFVPSLLLTKANRKRNLKNIEESLIEITEMNIVIESFVRMNDVFIIKFLPLEGDEQKKIIQSLKSYAERGLVLRLPFEVHT